MRFLRRLYDFARGDTLRFAGGRVHLWIAQDNSPRFYVRRYGWASDTVFWRVGYWGGLIKPRAGSHPARTP